MQFETPIKTIMNIGNTVSTKINIVYIITVLYRSSSPNNSSEAVENPFLKRTKLFCLNTLKINKHSQHQNKNDTNYMASKCKPQ